MMIATRTALTARHRGFAHISYEAQRYLAVVDAFRAEGCQPHWRSEPTPSFRLLQPPERRQSC